MEHDHRKMEHAEHGSEHHPQTGAHDSHGDGVNNAAPAPATGHPDHGGHGTHQADHTGHELMFRNRFWISLVLSIPVLLYSDMLQMWFGFTVPVFPGSQWIAPIFATLVFLIGGVPFLRMAVPEIRNRQPGMMVLISLAITVAYVYSLATLVIDPANGFFWELVTLIDIMLLGHWLEMRSVRQASGALQELAKLMPDTAERIAPDGTVETCPSAGSRPVTCCWFVPAPASRPTARWSKASPTSTRP